MLNFGFPQAVEVAISIDSYCFIVSQAEGDIGFVTGFQSLAQTAALEFWSLSQKDYKDAWQRYLRFVSFGGKKSFKELCAAAGIDDPFGEHALNGVARTANAWLDSNG